VPNPFNPSTRISYELPSRDAVSLKVYDVDGRLVRTLVSVVQGPGSFSVEWTGRNDNGEPVASGVYFYKLQAGSFVDAKKMVFLK
jgi:flagellar hook assembly protein FlgD